MDTRRQFLARSGAAAAAAVLAPQDALAAKRKRRAARRTCCAAAASRRACCPATPRPTRSRCSRSSTSVGGAGRVRLEVARDPDFRHVIARRDILTTPAVNHSVKARVTGLKPHKRYWYRFETRDRHSPVGRFQTALPPDSRETVRFGFFSCADFTHGYYNAYAAAGPRGPRLRRLASATTSTPRPPPTSATGGRCATTRSASPTRTTSMCCARPATLPEYRAKYALYRSDASLRRLHAHVPDGRDVGRPRGAEQLRQRRRRRRPAAAPGFSRARRDAAYQAFFESMPVFPARPLADLPHASATGAPSS